MKQAITDKAHALGFDAVGFAPAETTPAQQKDLKDFVAQGLHGDMGWMEDTLERRADPKVLWSKARTVISLGMNYAPAKSGPLDKDLGHISVYARNRDYHDVVKKKLKVLGRWMGETTGCELKVFVDTAPVMEVPLAARAGLGWQGKHTNLVSREFGSFLFIGEIFTVLELEPDPPAADHCGSCTKCLDACPTEAFIGPGKIDGRKCISYLNIEYKGLIPPDLMAKMGNRIYGCDDCTNACPWNRFATPTQEPAFQPRPELMAPRLVNLADLSDARFRDLFRASPVKRIGLERFLRNVLVAMGNSGDIGLVSDARRHLDSESELVRQTAFWAVDKLSR